MFTSQMAAPPSTACQSTKSVSQHLLDVWRGDKTYAPQKSWSIFTLLFQYPLHFFYSICMIGSSVICTRLSKTVNDCFYPTSFFGCCLSLKKFIFAEIWERAWKIGKQEDTFSPPSAGDNLVFDLSDRKGFRRLSICLWRLCLYVKIGFLNLIAEPLAFSVWQRRLLYVCRKSSLWSVNHRKPWVTITPGTRSTTKPMEMMWYVNPS